MLLIFSVFMLGLAAGIMLMGYLGHDENHRLIEERDEALKDTELGVSNVTVIPTGMANHPSAYHQLVGLEHQELPHDEDYNGWSEGLSVR